MATDTTETLSLPQALELPIKLPRNWERAFGYRGQARWLAAWWEPAGDEAEFDDGQLRADGEWQFYLDLVEGRLEVALTRLMADNPGGRWALGSSDEPATHCLLCDLDGRRIFVAPLAEARVFLRRQHAPEACTQSEMSEPLSVEVLEKILWDIANELTEEAGALPIVGSLRVCPAHCQHGWYLAPDGGYNPCPECGGAWLVAAGPQPSATV